VIYYHLTPSRNVGPILREGLKPSPGTALGSWDPNVEDTRGKIFLGTSEDESLYNFWNTRINNPQDTRRFKGWTMLRVNLPSRWSLSKDEYGFTYTRKSIPPKYISTLYSKSGTELFKNTLELDRAGAFIKWHEEVF